MNFKKAFTLIELLIVIIIIWLLMYSLKWTFSYKNVEKVKFDTCYIHTYSKITNFMQDALLQKMIYTWNNLTGVDLYTIKFDVTNQKLELIYSGSTKITKTLAYSWVLRSADDCYTKTYHTKLSWNNLKIDIKPGLQADINDSPVKLFTWSNTNFTTKSWSVDLWYCQWFDCKQKYRLTFIPSTYLLTTKYCIKLKNDGTCEKWSE